MTAHCDSCAYYDQHHSNTGKQAVAEGLCRFNPPVSQPAPEAHGLWPVVGKEDWCGHYSNEARMSSHAA